MLNGILLKKYLQEKSNELIMVRMFVGLAIAIFWVTPALYLKSQGFSNSFVGMMMSMISLVALVLSLLSTVLLEKYNEYKLFLISISMPAVMLVLLAIFPSLMLYLVFLITTMLFSVLRNNSFSIIFKDITKSSEYTKKESLVYSFGNVGWFLGPFIGGLLIDNYGFVEVFMLSAFFYVLAMFLSLMIHVKLRKKKREEIDRNIFRNLKHYFKKKELIKSYIIAGSSAAWYGMIFTYIPLFIVEGGLSEFWVGIFLSATQLPLIFIQFKLSWFVERLGIKKILILAYAYLIFVTVVLFVYPNIYLVMILLSSAAVSLAFIEPLREIYFFKNVTTLEEEKTYPIFHTSLSVGSIFSKALLAGVIFILPQHFLFIVVSVLMGGAFVVATRLKDYRN